MQRTSVNDKIPPYRCKFQVLLAISGIKDFLKIEKIMQNAISGKLKRLEQPYLDSSFATSECTLTAPHYRVENIEFGYSFLHYKNFEKKLKKNHEDAISRETKGFEQSHPPPLGVH